MRRLLVIVVGLGLAIFLVGCKVNVSTDLFISDIKTVRDGGKPLDLNGLLKFEIPSKTTFNRDQAKIEGLLKAHFKGVKNLRVIEQGMETYVAADIQLTLYNIDKEHSFGSDLISFAVVDHREKHNLTAVGLGISEEAYQTLAKDIRGKFIGKIDSDSIKVTVYVNNDESEPAAIGVASAYVDGQPFPLGKNITLDKRGKCELVISRIATVYALKNISGFMVIRIFEPKGGSK